MRGWINWFENLDLSLNECYCEGALVMARALKVYLNLRKVALERNEIGVEGARRFLQGSG